MGSPTGPPTGPPPAWNQTPWNPAASAPSAEPAPKKKTGLIIGLIVVLALIIGGIAAAAVVMMGSGPNLELDIEVCEIAADGTLTASGSVENTSGSTGDVDIEVVFHDDADDSIVARDSTDISVPGNSAERWTLSGTAGDQVQRVTCDVTAQN